MALATSLVLPPTWVRLHIVAGVSALALVAARIVWGFLGPTYARFSSFVRRPAEILDHAEQLRSGRAAHHLGHNPLGGAMIVALIAAVVVLAATGTVALGGVLKTGPLAFLTSFAVGNLDRDLHQLVAWGLIGLIALHIGGAIFESCRSRENLAAAMINGRKRERADAIAEPARVAHPWIAAAIVAVTFVASGLVRRRPRRPARPAACRWRRSIRSMPANAAIATRPTTRASSRRRCGSRSWMTSTSISARTPRLTPARSPASATTSSPMPPRRSTPSRPTCSAAATPADPLRITATPFWRHMHRGIPERVFAAKSVGARSNCAACHQRRGQPACSTLEPSPSRRTLT